jgi:hypothetical protein
MAKSTKKKFTDTTTYQAVCTRGDFNGIRRATEDEAEADAANHNSKPGNTNHIVKIITTVTTHKSVSNK